MNSYVKSRQQIAEEFGISTKTLYRWLKRAGIALPPGSVTPKGQEIIYSTFGEPVKEEIDNNSTRFLDQDHL